MTDGKRIILVLDTETLGVCDARVYDLGYIIADADGNVIKTRSYINKDIYDDGNLMKSAYYAKKLPLYEQRLADGYCKKMAWSYILRVLARDINKYEVDGLYAYNSSFDTRSIQTTCESCGVKTNPTADGIIDIWKGLVDPFITQTEDYIDFCFKNGFITKHKPPRTQAKAETLYKYLTGQTEYIEEHTALEDSKIELEILLKALKIAADGSRV